MELAFKVDRTNELVYGSMHRTRTGSISLPDELIDIVVGVFGLRITDQPPNLIAESRLSHLEPPKNRIVLTVISSHKYMISLPVREKVKQLH